MRRKCLIKQIIKEKTEKGRKDEEEDVSRYWITLRKQTILEFERITLGRTVWSTRFGRGCGPVVRQAA